VAQAGVALAARRGRLRWPSVARQTAIRLAGGAAVVTLLAIVATGLPGRAADGFADFKEPADPGDTSARFESASGNGRWQYWSRAAEAGAGAPLLGIGAGSFELFWAQDPGLPGSVRDAHSLYVETFGELGIPGLLLLISAVGWVLGFGLRRTLGATGARRALLAALLASASAFAVGAGIDWLWELAVLPVIFLLVAAALLAGDLGPGAAEGRRWRNGWSAVVALPALIVIASPLLGASAIQTSRAAFSSGDLDTALSRAERAQRWQPYAGTPHLQQALVLEAQDRLSRAATEARTAIDKEPTNWRPWFILSRIEAQRDKDRTEEALGAFARAEELNRNSELFRDTREPG
jgi:O-antigen ligase